MRKGNQIPATLQINIHPGQARVLGAVEQWIATGKPRFIFEFGGPQSGKTSFGPHLLHRMIEATAKTGDLNDYLAVEATFDLFKLKMLPELLDVFVRTLGIGKYWAEDKIIELSENLVPGKFLAHNSRDPMWGRIILRSADSEAGLESATVKAAWLD